MSLEFKPASLLSNKILCKKVAFPALHYFNKNIQGKNENILTCSGKCRSFKEKLPLWGARINRENKVEKFERREVSHDFGGSLNAACIISEFLCRL